jgi:hypothetical protein
MTANRALGAWRILFADKLSRPSSAAEDNTGPASAPSPARTGRRDLSRQPMLKFSLLVQSSRRRDCRVNVALWNTFTLFELGHQAVDLLNLAIQIGLRMWIL